LKNSTTSATAGSATTTCTDNKVINFGDTSRHGE
jgi:hypothetical protein